MAPLRTVPVAPLNARISNTGTRFVIAFLLCCCGLATTAEGLAQQYVVPWQSPLTQRYTIVVGDTIRWDWTDQRPHSLKLDTWPAGFTGWTYNGGSVYKVPYKPVRAPFNFSFTTTVAGTYTYHCSYDPKIMTGILQVLAAGSSSLPTTSPTPPAPTPAPPAPTPAPPAPTPAPPAPTPAPPAPTPAPPAPTPAPPAPTPAPPVPTLPVPTLLSGSSLSVGTSPQTPSTSSLSSSASMTRPGAIWMLGIILVSMTASLGRTWS